MYERAIWNAGLKKEITEEEYNRLSPDNKLYYRKQPEEDPRDLRPIDPKPFRLNKEEQTLTGDGTGQALPPFESHPPDEQQTDDGENYLSGKSI